MHSKKYRTLYARHSEEGYEAEYVHEKYDEGSG